MSMTRAVWSGVLGVCLVAASTTVLSRQDHVAGPAFDADTVRRIDAVFAPCDTTTSPGCAVGVVATASGVRPRLRDGQPRVRAAISPASIFHVASISKQFAAFSVAMLAHDGKLSLDDDIRKHVPEMPDFGKRHHHPSADPPHQRPARSWPCRPRRVARGRPDHRGRRADDGGQTARPELRSGREVLYSNTGYTLLGRDRHARSASRCASSPRSESSRRSA